MLRRHRALCSKDHDRIAFWEGFRKTAHEAVDALVDWHLNLPFLSSNKGKHHINDNPDSESQNSHYKINAVYHEYQGLLRSCHRFSNAIPPAHNEPAGGNEQGSFVPSVLKPLLSAQHEALRHSTQQTSHGALRRMVSTIPPPAFFLSSFVPSLPVVPLIAADAVAASTGLDVYMWHQSGYPHDGFAPGSGSDQKSLAVSDHGLRRSWGSRAGLVPLLPQPSHDTPFGGGLVQSTHEEALLCILIAAKEQAITAEIKRRYGRVPVDKERISELHNKLVVYYADNFIFDERIESTSLLAGASTMSPRPFQQLLQAAGLHHSRVLPTAFIHGVDNYSLQPAELHKAISDDLVKGFVPCLLITSVGSRATGAIDAVAGLCAVAHVAGVWTHIDCAGGTMIAPYHKNKALATFPFYAVSSNSHRKKEFIPDSIVIRGDDFGLNRVCFSYYASKGLALRAMQGLAGMSRLYEDLMEPAVPSFTFVSGPSPQQGIEGRAEGSWTCEPSVTSASAIALSALANGPEALFSPAQHANKAAKKLANAIRNLVDQKSLTKEPFPFELGCEPSSSTVVVGLRTGTAALVQEVAACFQALLLDIARNEAVSSYGLPPLVAASTSIRCLTIKDHRYIRVALPLGVTEKDVDAFLALLSMSYKNATNDA